jgi:hypothetical protein
VSTPSRDELRAHLVASRIAGEVDTPRDNNLRNYGLMADRHPSYLFGISPRGAWTRADVLALMAERVGVCPDPAYRHGVDTIDPDRTLDRLDALRDRLVVAAERHERVLVATGHPAGIFAIHLEVAMVLQRHGCTLLAPAPGWSFTTPDGGYREIRHVGHVAMVSDRGELRHTHSPQPMEAMLGALDEAGEPWPDLVVADHGWAGAAGQAGIEAVGYADCNDPVLFVAEAEGTVAVSVPLDDNVLPHLYAPVTAYLLDALWRCG